MRAMIVLSLLLCASAAHAERFHYSESQTQIITDLIGHEPELLLPGKWNRMYGFGTFAWANDTLYEVYGKHRIELELRCTAMDAVRVEDDSSRTVVVQITAYGEVHRLWIFMTWPDGEPLLQRIQACAARQR